MGVEEEVGVEVGVEVEVEVALISVTLTGSPNAISSTCATQHQQPHSHSAQLQRHHPNCVRPGEVVDAAVTGTNASVANEGEEPGDAGQGGPCHAKGVAALLRLVLGAEGGGGEDDGHARRVV